MLKHLNVLAVSGLALAALVMPARAQPAANGASEQFDAAIAACVSIIGGASLDDAANAANMSLGPAQRAADSAAAADPRYGVVDFFGAETPLRIRVEQHMSGDLELALLMLAADNTGKCQVSAIGRADFANIFARALFARQEDWIVDSESMMHRPNGDRLRVSSHRNPQNQVAFIHLYFVRAGA